MTVIDDHVTPHFRLIEFKCRSGIPVPPELGPNLRRLCLELEKLRTLIGDGPITIRSGYRDPKYNAAIGAALHSRHMTGEAADIVIAGLDVENLRYAVLGAIERGAMWNGGVGFYPPRPKRAIGWVHYDVRAAPARWNG